MERKDRHKRKHKHKAAHGKTERKRTIVDKHRTPPTQERGVQDVYNLHRSSSPENQSSAVSTKR